jgi:hypothetical protein
VAKTSAQLDREIREATGRKAAESPKQSRDRLAAELEELGPYNGWRFSYEYPGLFCYSRPGSPFLVFFTPDWDRAGTVPIQVQDAEGNYYEEHSDEVALPLEGRTGRMLQSLIRPTLDALVPRAKAGGRHTRVDPRSHRRR